MFQYDAFRPDKCGIVVHVARNSIGGYGINVIEYEPDAFERPRSLLLLDACLTIAGMDCRLVTFCYRNGYQRLFSKDSDWIEDVRRKNPRMGLPAGIEAIDMKIGPDGETNSCHIVKAK